MRGYCEKCWALVLLPRKRWLHEHHRVCSLLSTHIFQLPSYSESKGTSAYKRPPCDGVTCTTSWIFSLAPSPRMTFAHPPGEGERAKADLQSYWFLSAYKYQRIRPRGRPRCVTPSMYMYMYMYVHVCMYVRVVCTCIIFIHFMEPGGATHLGRLRGLTRWNLYATRTNMTAELPWRALPPLGGERMSCAGKALTKKSTTS